MKNKKFIRTIAASIMLAGAMLMATPNVALASKAYHPATNTISTAISGLRVETDDETDYIKWNNKLTGDEEINIEISTSADFSDSTTASVYGYSYSENKISLNRSFYFGEASSNYSYLKPGITYYIRAFYSNYDRTTYTDVYGPYSPVITYVKTMPDVYLGESTVTANSVYFRFTNSDVTGYEIWRANEDSTKYKLIATISDTQYTDSGLESDKAYNYRIRTYAYNQAGKKIYGDYRYLTQTTWGSALNVKATPTGTKSIKLTWKKVTGVTRYEIYRSAGSNSASTTKEGDSSYYSFTNFKLVKTINKGKTVSYTDKKLIPGQTYTYRVIAYKDIQNKNKNKNKIDKSLQLIDSDYATLDFGAPQIIKTVSNKNNGSKTVTWKKVIGASGYRIKRYDSEKDSYVVVATLKANKTSYTIPAADNNNSNDYRIYSYKGSKEKAGSYISPNSISSYKLSQPGSIKAVVNSSKSGITVSWKAVAGAAYYRVYRSRLLGSYNADMDIYYRPSSSTDVQLRTMDETQKGQLSADGSYYTTSPGYTTEIKGTSITDSYIGYTYSYDNGATIKTRDIQEGPEEGVRYYYYVQAYGNNGKPVGDADYQSYNSMYSKPASVILNKTTLKKPTSVKVTSKKSSQAVVTWKKVSGAKKYYVYYSTSKNKNYVLAGTTTKNKLTVKNLTSKKKYYFRVTAYKTNAAGADLFSANATTKKSIKIK